MTNYAFGIIANSSLTMLLQVDNFDFFFAIFSTMKSSTIPCDLGQYSAHEDTKTGFIAVRYQHVRLGGVYWIQTTIQVVGEQISNLCTRWFFFCFFFFFNLDKLLMMTVHNCISRAKQVEESEGKN